MLELENVAGNIQLNHYRQQKGRIEPTEYVWGEHGKVENFRADVFPKLNTVFDSRDKLVNL